MNWLTTSLMLCVFGFLKEIRPSEVFVIDYMLPPWREITPEEVNKIVWPMCNYSLPVFLLIVLFVTDSLRYKPVIVASGMFGIVGWAFLVWTTSFAGVIAGQLCCSAFMACCEVAYYTYIYAKVEKEHYLQVTAHTRAAVFCGKCCSGLLAQVLISSAATDLRGLNVISLCMMVAATLWAIFLPPVSVSIYSGRRDTNCAHGNATAMAEMQEEIKMETENGAESKITIRDSFQIMRFQMKSAYSNPHVLLWSFWYAVGLCGFFQVYYYIQMLWIEIDNRPEVRWNGAVEAGTTLLGAAITLLAGRVHENTLKSTRIFWALVLVALLQAGGLFVATNTYNRFISYGGYIFFFILHSFTITISSAEIAKRLPEDSYGLIFGINTFFVCFLQSVLTLVVVSDTFGLKLNVREQFNIYAWGFVVLGALYLVPIKWKWINIDYGKEAMQRCNKSDNDKCETGTF